MFIKTGLWPATDLYYSPQKAQNSIFSTVKQKQIILPESEKEVETNCKYKNKNEIAI